MKLDQLFGSGTEPSITGFLIGWQPWTRCDLAGIIFDVMFLVLVKSYISSIRSCSTCSTKSLKIHQLGHQMCLALFQRVITMAWPSIIKVDGAFVSISGGVDTFCMSTSIKDDLFPTQRLPSISASDTGTGISSCFKTLPRLTCRPAP